MSIQNSNVIIVIVKCSNTNSSLDSAHLVKSSSSFSLVKSISMNHIHAHEDTSQVLLLFIHGIRDGERIQVERSVEVQR